MTSTAVVSSTNSPTFPSPPSEIEAKYYYAGLSSLPTLIARTSTTPWEMPITQGALKEVHPIGNHAPKLKEAMKGSLAPQLHALLGSMGVKWRHIEVVRIGHVEDYYPLTILMIGVPPASLSGHDGVGVVLKCRELLKDYDITDVEVEIYESVDYPGPWSDVEPDPNVRDPHRSDCNFGLLNDTQRHLHLFLFGDATLKKYLGSIMVQIGDKMMACGPKEERVRALERSGFPATSKARRRVQGELDETRKAIKELSALHKDVSARWVTSESRTLDPNVL
ncbi:hypothetical protein BOTBODRAFT_471103 [Botryobasidium botryosum FD-172 SS1]|uniref:Uncharacterized protein n=1 Tax=Botryobasidium botryosum (strain FD-172 SS1) TaxID=930990 RepID=A0A067M859_BOTB1|nr:hypothetical protein BOTBODRAFT_471103 [Botryobasidium botryosum FD-172 SS1]